MFYYSATGQEDAYVPVFQTNSSAQEVGPGVLETKSRYFTKYEFIKARFKAWKIDAYNCPFSECPLLGLYLVKIHSGSRKFIHMFGQKHCTLI